MPHTKLTDKSEVNRCPNCRSRDIRYVHCLSHRLPWWWYVECWNCHCCGKTKLGLNRAIKSWNKDSEKKRGANR